MMEQWATIPEAPKYEVSDRGRIRNKTTLRILRTRDNGRGTSQVSLRDAGATITRSVPALQKQSFRLP